jgi:hypothetical protein
MRNEKKTFLRHNEPSKMVYFLSYVLLKTNFFCQMAIVKNRVGFKTPCHMFNMHSGEVPAYLSQHFSNFYSK